MAKERSRELLDSNIPSDLIDMPSSEQETIKDFYNDVIRRFASNRIKEMQDELQFIVVGHAVPTLPFYLEALNQIGDIAAIITKGSIADNNIKTWLKESLITKNIITKEEFKVPKEDVEAQKLNFQLLEQPEEKTLRELGNFSTEGNEIKEWLALDGAYFINKWAQGDKKTIIIDIGGYFSYTLGDLLSKKAQLKNNLLGIIEDTENGHQKYHEWLERGKDKLLSEDLLNEKGLNDFLEKYDAGKEVKSQVSEIIKNNCIAKAPPIISVARSYIKRSEDYNVGKAITDAIDHILRVEDYTHLAESKTIFVIGYGKIGSAAAKVAAEKTRGPVLIYEADQVRRLEASSHSFKVVSLYKGLKQADIVICCTGNKCLSKQHIPFLKNNVYIASCTSRDDEFTKEFLEELEQHGRKSAASDEEKKKTKDHNKLINYILSYLKLNKTIKEKLGENFLNELITNTMSDNKLVSFISSHKTLKNLKEEERKDFLSNMNKHIKGLDRKDDISRYMFGGKTVNFLNNGNSVNFVEKAVHGYFIHGVLASLVTSAIIIYLDYKGLLPKTVLQKGQINDFNELKGINTSASEELKLDNNSCQSIIAEILMRHKLRDEPIISNIKINQEKRYLPRDAENDDLTKKLRNHMIVRITGGEKFGKSQIAERFFILNKGRYDISWKFNAKISFEEQFKALAIKINSKINKGVFSGEKINIEGGDGTIISRVNKYLTEYSYSYLLIFEDMHESKIEIGKLLPSESKKKKEHIILTHDSTKKMLPADTQSTVEPQHHTQSSSPIMQNRTLRHNELILYREEVPLKKFGELELFKFLINDPDLWIKKEFKFKKLAWALANNKQDINTYEGENDVSAPDDQQPEFVGIINLAAEFIRYHYKQDSNVLEQIISYMEDKGKKDADNVNNIHCFLKFAIGTLHDTEKELLEIFYILNIKEPRFIISQEGLIKLSEKKGGGQELVKKLESMGFIERDEENMFRAVYRGSNATLELFTPQDHKAEGKKEKEKEKEKEKDEGGNNAREPIRRNNQLKQAISIIVKNFFIKGKEFKSENLVKEIIEYIHDIKIEHDSYRDQKYEDKNLYKDWSNHNKHLHVKLLNKFAKYYKGTNTPTSKFCYQKAQEILKKIGEDKSEKYQHIEQHLETLQKETLQNEMEDKQHSSSSSSSPHLNQRSSFTAKVTQPKQGLNTPSTSPKIG